MRRFRRSFPVLGRIAGLDPGDIDTNALLKEWQDKLLGVDGELVDHLK
ncbi:Uncharacterised protein [Mycobacteroides abscessus subsp. abscessus]|nr:Uncharacterised protein [Mycobacteroides abscessus subsp. abscessus]